MKHETPDSTFFVLESFEGSLCETDVVKTFSNEEEDLIKAFRMLRPHMKRITKVFCGIGCLLYYDMDEQGDFGEPYH